MVFKRSAFSGLFLCLFLLTPSAANETFGAKLRRLAAAAQISNSITNPPLIPTAFMIDRYVPNPAGR
jgi:hypothetical protein